MKTVPLLIAFVIGISSAAMQQPRASPVYSPPSSQQSMNGPQMKSTSALPQSMTPAPLNTPVSPQPVAQPRESIASEASMMQPTAVNPSSTPSQNYYVYYYPHNGQTTVGQPNSSSLWSWTGWNDVAAGVGSLALVLIGGGILYSRYGNEVKSRAIRELQDLTADDAARMARGVLRALEKFSSLNNNTE